MGTLCAPLPEVLRTCFDANARQLLGAFVRTLECQLVLFVTTVVRNMTFAAAACSRTTTSLRVAVLDRKRRARMSAHLGG
jgi:hypothetical protein